MSPHSPGSEDASLAASVPSPDRVQSTATGDLLAKLHTAPKLDTQRFKLEGELGQGGMGVVLRIHDQVLNRRLAMKVLLERRAPVDAQEQRLANQLLGRFLEEAQVTSQLDHPGVVPVHELGLDATGKVYFTMRMVKGRTAHEAFADAVAGNGEWNLTRALEVVLKVCDTMAYAHDKGVLHRDLKPGNVMVGRFGEVYVMDWGLAKVVGQSDRHDLRIRPESATVASHLETARKCDAESDTPNSVVSLDGQQLGTPSYMSPEQARSEELDARTDIYSIGAMLYELVTGRAPYRVPNLRQSAYRILRDVVEGPPSRIEDLRPGLPAELVAVIDKAMARDREQRYRTVVELAADLRAFLAQRVVTAYRTGAWQEARLWVRRNRALAASLAVAVLLLVLGITGTTAYAQRFAGKVAEFQQLAMAVTLDQLTREETALTGMPHQAEALASWLVRARELLTRREELRSVATQIEAGLAGQDAAAPDAVAGRFLASTLEGLAQKLPALATRTGNMEQRLLWARLSAPVLAVHPKARYTLEQARSEVARDPHYAGQNVSLTEQDMGWLVPLGPNPRSGLWEFYDLRSAWDGATDPATLPIPVAKPDGSYAIAADSGIVFVLVPGGSLPEKTPLAKASDSPRLAVKLAPFLFGKYEMTRAQWRRLGGAVTELAIADEGTRPVTELDWFTATATLARFGLELPSELQWEYAIRGGTVTQWWWGDSPFHHDGDETSPESVPDPVGSAQPNPFGLHDMGGNVWEWCHDEFADYGTEQPGDGRRPELFDMPRFRCVRGGGFDWGPTAMRSDIRNVYVPSYKFAGLGLRPVRRLAR